MRQVTATEAARRFSEMLDSVENGRERFVVMRRGRAVATIGPAARAHATLLAHTRRQGQQRGAHDLLIAATAHATDRTVVTADRGGFIDLPGVRVRQRAD